MKFLCRISLCFFFVLSGCGEDPKPVMKFRIMDTPYGKVWVASASLQTDGDPSSQLFVLSILDEFDDMTPSISYDEGRAAFFVELGELEAKLPKGVSLYRSGNQLVQLSSVPPKDIADGSKILEILEEALRND